MCRVGSNFDFDLEGKQWFSAVVRLRVGVVGGKCKLDI